MSDDSPTRKELQEILATVNQIKKQVEVLLKEHDKTIKDVLDRHWEGYE